MKQHFTAVVTLLASALVCAPAESQSAPVPVLLELFTSEGCSSCPPADHLLGILDQQPIPGVELIVPSEHVGYWDRLGWKDPFSSPQFTARQQDYASRFKGDGPYTPQWVVDGRFGFVGSDAREAESAIHRALRGPKLPIAISQTSRTGSEVAARIEVPPADSSTQNRRAVLYVALADDRAESHVAREENAGRYLMHVAVTRVLTQVGTVDLSTANDRNITIAIQPEAGANGWRLVAFLQDPNTGRVLAVAAQKL
jgi:hypothetical protein